MQKKRQATDDMSWFEKVKAGVKLRARNGSMILHRLAVVRLGPRFPSRSGLTACSSRVRVWIAKEKSLLYEEYSTGIFCAS